MKDQDILALFFARDEAALTETAAKYGHSLLRLSENITKNSSDAEECVNDTYLAAWEAIPPERPVHFFAWLAKVARNNACRYLQAKTRQKRAAETVELTDELAACLPAESDLLSELENERLGGVLDSFVRSLDDDAQYVFMQRYFFSEPIGEIARMTGFSESKIKSMLLRSRRKLKQRLEKEGFTI